MAPKLLKSDIIKESCRGHWKCTARSESLEKGPERRLHAPLPASANWMRPCPPPSLSRGTAAEAGLSEISRLCEWDTVSTVRAAALTEFVGNQASPGLLQPPQSKHRRKTCNRFVEATRLIWSFSRCRLAPRAPRPGPLFGAVSNARSGAVGG